MGTVLDCSSPDWSGNGLSVRGQQRQITENGVAVSLHIHTGSSFCFVYTSQTTILNGPVFFCATIVCSLFIPHYRLTVYLRLLLCVFPILVI